MADFDFAVTNDLYLRVPGSNARDIVHAAVQHGGEDA